MSNEAKELTPQPPARTSLSLAPHPPVRTSLSLPRNSTAFSRVPVLSSEIPTSLLQCSVCNRDVARDNHYFLCHHPSHHDQSSSIKSSSDVALAAGVDPRLLSRVQQKHKYGLVFCSICEPSHDPTHLVVRAASTLFSQKPSLPDVEDTRVHGAKCSACGAYPIVKTRLSCATCADYDLCETCALTSKHQIKHVFIKHRKPVSIVDPAYKPDTDPSISSVLAENALNFASVCYRYNELRMERRNALRILNELSKFISRDKPISTYDDLFYLVSNLAWLEVYKFTGECDQRVQEFLHATLYSNVPDGAYYALRTFGLSSGGAQESTAYKDLKYQVKATFLFQLVDYVYSLQKRYQCGETLELELQPLYDWMNLTFFRQTKETLLLLRSITIAIDKSLHQVQNWKGNLDSLVLAIFIGIFTAIFSVYVIS